MKFSSSPTLEIFLVGAAYRAQTLSGRHHVRCHRPVGNNGFKEQFWKRKWQGVRWQKW